MEKIKKRSFDRFLKKTAFLPNIKGKDRSVSEKDFSSSKILKNDSISTDMSILSDLDMNEIDKRLIMEEFFGNEDVKKHVYKLLFEGRSKNEPNTV